MAGGGRGTRRGTARDSLAPRSLCSLGFRVTAGRPGTAPATAASPGAKSSRGGVCGDPSLGGTSLGWGSQRWWRGGGMEVPWVVPREKDGDARRWCLDKDGDAQGWCWMGRLGVLRDGAGGGWGCPGMVAHGQDAAAQGWELAEGGRTQGWCQTGRLEVPRDGAR